MPNLKQKEDAGDDTDTGETSLGGYALWALAISRRGCHYRKPHLMQMIYI